MTTSHAYAYHAFCAVIHTDLTGSPSIITTLYGPGMEKLKNRAERVSTNYARLNPGEEIFTDYHRWNKITRKWIYVESSQVVILPKQLASV
jgi:hypothetical protein